MVTVYIQEMIIFGPLTLSKLLQAMLSTDQNDEQLDSDYDEKFNEPPTKFKLSIVLNSTFSSRIKLERNEVTIQYYKQSTSIVLSFTNRFHSHSFPLAITETQIQLSSREIESNEITSGSNGSAV